MREAHLVAVDVDRALFTWRELAVIPLGTAAGRPSLAGGFMNIVAAGACVGTVIQAGDFTGEISL